MRFLTGLIVGVILTIGTAYVADAMRALPGPDDKAAARMVNWDVVGDDLREFSISARDAWAHLVGAAKEVDKKVEKTKT